jgi:hypothetical protein
VFFPAKQIASSITHFEKEALLKFLGSEPSKTEENNCFPSPEINPPFLSSFLKSVL